MMGAAASDKLARFIFEKTQERYQEPILLNIFFFSKLASSFCKLDPFSTTQNNSVGNETV
jgi:hypothetical protein